VTLVVAASLKPVTVVTSVAAVAVMVGSLFFGSLCAGAVFALSARMMAADPVALGSKLYSTDLLGSALGALLVGPLLFPLLGVHIMALSAAGLVALGGIVSLTSPVWRGYGKA
jgi:hypothetical protein